MNDILEEAISAAAEAIARHSLIAKWNADGSREWMSSPDEFRAIARTAIEAALPWLLPGN